MILDDSLIDIDPAGAASGVDLDGVVGRIHTICQRTPCQPLPIPFCLPTRPDPRLGVALETVSTGVDEKREGGRTHRSRTHTPHHEIADPPHRPRVLASCR